MRAEQEQEDPDANLYDSLPERPPEITAPVDPPASPRSNLSSDSDGSTDDFVCSFLEPLITHEQCRHMHWKNSCFKTNSNNSISV